MRFSKEGQFSGSVAFVGYGVSAPEMGYDDYAGIDVKGKVVIAMRYEPMDARGQSRLAPRGDVSGWSEHATFSAKTKAAADHGAAALLLVNPPDSEPDLLIPFSGTFANPATIAVFQIKQAAVNQILTAAACTGPENAARQHHRVVQAAIADPRGPDRFGGGADRIA